MAIATSYERTRTNAYSEDLRWRIIYQRKALSYSLQRVAENLGVRVATAHRIETLFDETGSVGKRKYPDGHGTHKLTENDKVLILGLLVERPETYLREIQRELQALNGTDVDISTIWRCIHNGFTHTKLKTAALQRNEMIREEYIDRKSMFYTKKCLCLLMRQGQIVMMHYESLDIVSEANKQHHKSFLSGGRECQLLELCPLREF